MINLESEPPLSDVTERAETVIKLQDVHKSYGSLDVLQGLGLHVNRGEVYGFLGRNGAGKSTAIRILMGITSLNKGSIDLFGERVGKNPVKLRQRIGYVAQEQHFYPWMSPRYLGKFVSGFYPRWDAHRYQQLLDSFKLPEHRKLGVFSGGMKAKLALSVALATRPELLILDEPTAGLDPVARREFLDLVGEQAAREGATIFFSTHLIDDIEAVADRIAIVEEGKAVYEGELAPLSNAIATYSIAVEHDIPGTLPVSIACDEARILQNMERHGRRVLVLQFPVQVPQHPVLAPGWRQEAMSLEDVFIAVVSSIHHN